MLLVKQGTSLYAIMDNNKRIVYTKGDIDQKYPEDITIEDLYLASFVELEESKKRLGSMYSVRISTNEYEIGDQVYLPFLGDPIGVILKIEKYECTWNYEVKDVKTGDVGWWLKQHIPNRVYRTRKIQDSILKNKSTNN